MSNNKVDHDSSDDEEDLPPPLADEKVEEVAEDTTLANSDVTTKHQEAGKIAQDAIETVAKLVSKRYVHEHTCVVDLILLLSFISHIHI